MPRSRRGVTRLPLSPYPGYGLGMPDVDDEPTVPIGPVPGGFGSADEPGPAGGGAEPASGGGAHRRDTDGPDGERRWPWLAGLGVLALLALSGLIWLVGSIPHPASNQRSAPTAAPTDELSTPDATAGTQPPPSEGATSTATSSPTGTPTASPSTSQVATPTPSTVATPTRPPAPSQVRVPDVVGKRQASAAAVLRGAGFSVAVVRVGTDTRRQVNRVISQSPAAGQTATVGSTVTIFVGATTTG
jgi:hypothetical protein